MVDDCRPTYSDDSSDTIAAPLFTRRRLKTRPGPFGVRMMAWYDTSDVLDPFVGSRGGSPGFTIIPAAVQNAQSLKSLSAMLASRNVSSRLGGTQIPGFSPEFFVDGGVLWIPFAATIYWDWPDKESRNTGDVFYTCEDWDGEFGTGTSSGLSFTAYLTNGQTIAINPTVRRAVCSLPYAALTLPGGIVAQTGALPVTLAGALTVTMTFLAGVPAGVTRVPVTFYYTF